MTVATFRLTPVATTPELTLSWSVPVGSNSPFHEELRRALENTHGVEYVFIKRYSATIEYAPVVTLEQALREVYESIHNEAELRYQLNRSLPEDEQVDELIVEVEPKILR